MLMRWFGYFILGFIIAFGFNYFAIIITENYTYPKVYSIIFSVLGGIIVARTLMKFPSKY